MRRSTQLKLIFEELRRAAGPDAAAGDLLRLAHLVLRAYTFEPTHDDDFGHERDTRSFVSLPVDEAMQDGGWKILSFESSRAAGGSETDASDSAVLYRHIAHFLGPEWQQRFPPG